MLRSLILMLLLISLCGCGTIQKADDVLAWTKDKFNQVDTKIEAVKAGQEARVAKLEAVTGAFDRDGDGSVSAGEAKAVVVDATKTPEGRRLLLDPEFWLGLSGAVAGLYGVKRGVATLYNGPPRPPAPPAATT